MRKSGILIAQGGDPEHIDVIQKGARPEEYYNQEQKEKKLMQRLDKNCLPFEKYECRSKIRGIYYKDTQLPEEQFDLMEICEGK